MEKTLKYVDNNYDNYVEELKDYLKIPSISALSSHKKDMLTCAEFVEKKLKDAGMTRTEIFKTEGHPIVYGERLNAPGKPTVLVYGHYDVQPVDPLDLWDSKPFEPVVKDGKMYARGANDNKGQNLVHIKSVEALVKNEGELPVNVKFIIEGEEEIGSPNLEIFLKDKKDLLSCDAVLISDTSLYGPGIPTINYGLRGLAYFELEVTGPNRDLHSGSFGGSVANPINELAKIIAKIQDDNGKILIPGIYDDVQNMTESELDNMKKLNFSDEEYSKELNVKELYGEEGYSTLQRLWARPTFDCNGIFGGFTEEGAKTVLPSKATAKFSFRLVPDQNPKKVGELLKDYLKKIVPDYVKYELREMHGGLPVVIPLESEAMKAAANAVSKAFGKETVFTREGGSIPIVVEFVRQLNAPAILMGLGLDTDNIHSPNEHFSMDSFKKGIYSSVYFMDEFSKVK